MAESPDGEHGQTGLSHAPAAREVDGKAGARGTHFTMQTAGSELVNKSTARADCRVAQSRTPRLSI